jgi:hypothetical protein
LQGQRVQQRQGGAVRGGDRQVDVFDRPLQRELGREVFLLDLVQFGVSDRGIQRAAFDRLGEAGGVHAEPPGQFHRLGDAFDEGGHVGIDDQFEAANAPATSPPKITDSMASGQEWVTGTGHSAGGSPAIAAATGR